jgi:hypothetical protein
MLPVLPSVKLPPSFANLPKPVKLVRTTTSAATIERELREWKRAIGGGASAGAGK